MGWAFSDKALEKRDENRKTFLRLYPKTKRVWVDSITKLLNITDNDLAEFMCYQQCESGYGNVEYKILSNPFNFTKDECALVCDNGNLCYGYRSLGANKFTIYID